MGILNFDEPGDLTIRVGAKHSFVWTMEQYQDDAETIPMNFTGTHKIVLSEDNAGVNIAYTIDVSNIMVIAGNKMTIDFTTALNNFKPMEYFLDWRMDDSTGHSTHNAKGKAIFNHTQAKP